MEEARRDRVLRESDAGGVVDIDDTETAGDEKRDDDVPGIQGRGRGGDGRGVGAAAALRSSTLLFAPPKLLRNVAELIHCSVR
jgi:hypothetical protein